MRRPAWKLACAVLPCRGSTQEGCLVASSEALNNASSILCRSDIPRDGSAATQSPWGVALNQRSRGGYPPVGGYRCFSAISASNAPASPKSTTPTSDPSPPVPSDEELFVGGYTPITRQLWLERTSAARQAGAGPVTFALASPTTETRPPKLIAVTYQFSTDKVLQEMYRNPWGHMRVGRLLEDLDSLAGNVAFDHCHTGGSALPLLVTASVDEISVRHPLRLERDVVVRGQVVWTGRSALDIRMQLFQEQHDPEPSLEALFSFVHLDPRTRRAAPVVQLQPSSPQDVAVFGERQRVADARKAARQQQQLQSPVLPPEARAWVAAARRLQELPALASSDAVLMPQTCQHNTFVCQPQVRNIHGRIFGGFLMRRAYELGFATTYMFGGSRPVFQKVDEITFSRPVDMGDLLRLTSTVVHAEQLDSSKGRVIVEVEARVTKPEVLESYVTNTFRFVFNVVGATGAPPLRLKRVLPTCDEEALRCWNAQRDEL